MITRAIHIGLILLILYLVSVLMIPFAPFAHIVWVVIFLLALAYVLVGDRL